MQGRAIRVVRLVQGTGVLPVLTARPVHGGQLELFGREDGAEMKHRQAPSAKERYLNAACRLNAERDHFVSSRDRRADADQCPRAQVYLGACAARVWDIHVVTRQAHSTPCSCHATITSRELTRYECDPTYRIIWEGPRTPVVVRRKIGDFVAGEFLQVYSGLLKNALVKRDPVRIRDDDVPVEFLKVVVAGDAQIMVFHDGTREWLLSATDRGAYAAFLGEEKLGEFYDEETARIVVLAQMRRCYPSILTGYTESVCGVQHQFVYQEMSDYEFQKLLARMRDEGQQDGKLLPSAEPNDYLFPYDNFQIGSRQDANATVWLAPGQLAEAEKAYAAGVLAGLGRRARSVPPRSD